MNIPLILDVAPTIKKTICDLKMNASISSAASALLFVINPRYGLHSVPYITFLVILPLMM